MTKNLKIFVLDNVKSIRSRVKLLLNTKQYTVYEASNSTEFFNILAQNSYNANLIIIDIDLKDEDGFKVIKKLRGKNKVVPIMVMTANNHRSYFLEILNNKVLKLLKVSENPIENKVILNLPFFIQSEFKKATKGKYSVSTMLTTFYKESNVFSNEIDSEYNNLSEYIYDNLKSIFWDTDIFIPYASQNFIGVFPFASGENKDIISGKVDVCFNDLKLKEPKLKGYHLSNVFVTYPQDIKEDEDIFLKLIEKTKEEIKATKKVT
jgi:CheY-like chemotaxis protein